MTDKQDPITHAARLLREAAEELRQAHTLSSDRNNWIGEPEAKAAYDEHMAAAQALEDWEAAVGAGGVQALSAAPAGWRELAAKVMDALADAQDTTNSQYPEHVRCYPSWERHARWLRWHADMFRSGNPVGNGAGNPDVLAALAASPTPPAEQQARWVERWHGSGGKEFWEGWSILNAANREMIAHLGPDVDPGVVRGIVTAHNDALCGECAGTGGRWCPACAGATPSAEQQAAPKAAPAKAADSAPEDAGGANWQDISTAPKDGTRFVAVGNNYGLYSETQHVCIAQWFRGCWMEASDWNETSELKYLTHWMPLPSPPDDVAAPAPQQAAPKAAPGEPIAWTPGPNPFKDWCAQWFGPDSDDDYLAKAVFNLPPMAQVFKEAAPQQGGRAATARLPEHLTLAVDQWFAQNTGHGGCSDKDVAQLAAIFYGVTYEGGRESVDDALAVVEGFGPGIEGLNDTYARQVLLAQEVRRLHGEYMRSMESHQITRNALRAALDHIEMDALRISHCKDAAAIDAARECQQATPQQGAQEPYAYAVYFPDQPTVELVHDLDDLIDDLTNRQHTVTKLYTAPQQEPAPLSDDVVKDAARYRWLRTNAIGAFRTNNGNGPVSVYHLSKIPALAGIPEETDAAIDAAIAAQRGK